MASNRKKQKTCNSWCGLSAANVPLLAIAKAVKLDFFTARVQMDGGGGQRGLCQVQHELHKFPGCENVCRTKTGRSWRKTVEGPARRACSSCRPLWRASAGNRNERADLWQDKTAMTSTLPGGGKVCQRAAAPTRLGPELQDWKRAAASPSVSFRSFLLPRKDGWAHLKISDESLRGITGVTVEVLKYKADKISSRCYESPSLYRMGKKKNVLPFNILLFSSIASYTQDIVFKCQHEKMLFRFNKRRPEIMKPDWPGLGHQKECELQSPGRKFRLIPFTILISLAVMGTPL